MDKFGIFKLLNSFLGSNNQNNDNTSGENKQSANDLSGFLSALSNANTPSKQPQKSEPKSAPPLQASMLSTMNSHDEFIKRVKEKHQTTT